MLTFFEYLRQRAFESVMTGAYEALELLEAKKSLEAPKEKKWTCKPDNKISGILKAKSDDTLSAKLASLVSIARDKKKIESEIILTEAGFQRCEREKVSSPKHFFMDSDKEIEITSYRSFDDMIYFLGETLRDNDEGMHLGGREKNLFSINRDLLAQDNYAVSVLHGGRTYRAGKLADETSHTGSVLAILSQMLIFNQNPKFLEAPENFFN